MIDGRSGSKMVSVGGIAPLTGVSTSRSCKPNVGQVAKIAARSHRDHECRPRFRPDPACSGLFRERPRTTTRERCHFIFSFLQFSWKRSDRVGTNLKKALHRRCFQASRRFRPCADDRWIGSEPVGTEVTSPRWSWRWAHCGQWRRTSPPDSLAPVSGARWCRP